MLQKEERYFFLCKNLCGFKGKNHSSIQIVCKKSNTFNKFQTTPKRYKNVTTEAHANNGVINSLVVMGCQGNSSVNNGSNLVNQANVIIKSNTSSSQHYSGSTSSVTASPSSPQHSHSTEGSDHQSALEICEESDRYASHIVTLNHNFSFYLKYLRL